jgi:isopenicillin-N epimerase
LSTDLRDRYLLDPDVTFLNHDSYGACPRPVFEAYQAWQLRLERQPVAFLDLVHGIGLKLAEARTALAAEVGAEPDDLVGLTNATMALNIVAQSLPLTPGDEVLTTDHEYAALDKTWTYVARRSGAKIVAVRLPLPLESEASFTGALLDAMTPRTRVLFLSHITSATSLRLPIGRIVQSALERGIWTVIDGAHAPGHIPLDLDALGADAYAGNCHK